MKTKNQKILKKTISNILKRIIYFIILILAVYNIVYNIYHAIKSEGILGIFGYKIIIMENTTMEDTINVNDVVIIKKCKEDKIQEQDIIAYNLDISSRYATICRITKITETIEGKEYTTKGDNSYYYDIKTLTFEEIGGKVILIIPKFGWILKIFQSKVVTVLIIIYLFVRYRYIKYREKQNKIREKKLNNNVK